VGRPLVLVANSEFSLIIVRHLVNEMVRRASDLASFCEHGNEPFGSIKGRENLDQLSDY